MKKFIKKLWKQVRCSHEWRGRGYSYIECLSCGKVRYNPAKCTEWNRAYFQKMVDAGVWDKEEVNSDIRTKLHGYTVN